MTEKLPTVLPGGALMPHMSSRRRHEIADIVFEQIGGVERLVDEADKDPKWFYDSIWAKGLPKAVAHDPAKAADSMEALLEKLERADNAIDITPNQQEDKDAA